MTDQTTDAVAADPAAPQTQEPTAPAQEPVEPQAEPADDAGQPDEAAASDDSPADDPADDGKPRKKGGFQKKIDELTRKNYLAEEKARQLEARLRDLEQPKPQAKPQPTQSQPPQTPKSDEPLLEEHNTVEEWQAAHREWAKKKGLEEGIAEGRRLAQEEWSKQQEAEQAKAVKSAMDARELEARKKYKDYVDIVEPFGPILMGHPVIAEYIAHEDMGAEVAYHLARNPAVLEELRGMSDFKAGRKLLELEARLKAPPPPKPVTNAPDPITPVGARETVTKTIADLAASDDVSAYIRKMNKVGR